MKKCLTLHIILLLAFLSVCFLTVSCDGNLGMHHGEIRISFDDSYRVMTRAGLTLPDTSDFLLTVKDPSGKIIYEGKYGDSPEVLKVSSGSCTVSVLSSEFKAPAFSSPQFGDEQCVVVPSGGVVSVKLLCTQQNCGVKLKIAPEFLTACPNSVLFLKSAQGKLMYGYSEKRTAYFCPGTVSLVMSTSQQEQTLMSRTLLARDMLAISVGAVVPSSPSKEGISISIDTSRVWTDASFIVGEGESSGGSSDDAMTIAQARESIGATEVWVCGYIVGGDLTSASAKYDPPFSSRTNILIGPRSSIIDRSSGMSVSLPAGSVRDALNLVDNPELLGRKVMVRGDIVEAYFGLPGIKNVTEYSFP